MKVRIIQSYCHVHKYKKDLEQYQKEWGEHIKYDEPGPSIYYDIDLDTMPREGDRIETIFGLSIVEHSCIFGLPHTNQSNSIFDAHFICVEPE